MAVNVLTTMHGQNHIKFLHNFLVAYKIIPWAHLPATFPLPFCFLTENIVRNS